MGFLLLIIVIVIIIALANSSTPKQRRSRRTTVAAPYRVSQPSVHARTTRQSNNRVTFEIVIDDGQHPFRSENAFRKDGDSYWKPLGSQNTVGGYAVGGGIYLGQNLGAATGWGIEPALIDDKLPIDRTHPNRMGDGMPYWPSYSDVSPAARAGYLEWLSTGRSDPHAYIGYVFIYFYGLERRYFVDARTSALARTEQSAIRNEVARLFTIYSSNGSFRGYAGAFLEAADVVSSTGKIHKKQPPTDARFGVPLSVRIALGEMASAGKPVPAQWALAWLRSTNPAARRTPIERCRAEFDQLFSVRYAERFGEGLTIQKGSAPIKATYRAASAGLREIDLGIASVTDAASNGIPRPLEQLAEDCTNDLDAYSRWLRKNPTGHGSVAALALLPTELARDASSPTSRALSKLLEGQLAGKSSQVIAADDLLFHWPCSTPDKIRKSEAVLLSQALQKIGFGIEPDVRFGGPTIQLRERVVLFRLPPDAHAAPTSEFSSAALLLQLGALISAADGIVSAEERRLIEKRIADDALLSTDEQSRLSARLQWLFESPARTAGLKKQVENLSELDRKTIRMFLVSVAIADGRIAPEEIDALRRTYKILGLSPDDVYSDVHSSTTVATEDHPVPIVSETPATSYRVPRQARHEVALDDAAIKRKLVESARVSALLSDIFPDSGDAKPASVGIPTVAASSRAVTKLGLNNAAFMQALATRCEWTRAEIEQLAADVSLLVDGALEKINDFAFEEAGEPFWEGEESIQINKEVARQLT